ncbi:MAG: hypothetical protein WCV69_00455 [Patescibacteria group bacterium]|jgi:hypothetical protein
MERPEAPKTPEQIIEEKKTELIKAAENMMDWQVAKSLKERLLPPALDGLTIEELEYCEQLLRFIDHHHYLKSKLASAAKDLLREDEEALNSMGAKIGPERVQALRQIFLGKKKED